MYVQERLPYPSTMMHPQSAFLSTLLLCSLLLQGYGRELVVVDTKTPAVKLEAMRNRMREMVEVMDYNDPGPNTNPKNGFLVSPPPPAPPPPPYG